MVEVGTNPLPVTVIVAAVVVPTYKLEGLSLIAPATGLFTVRVVAAEVPPPGTEFTAVTERMPAAAKSVEGSTALTCVELMNVVDRAEPLTLITVDGTKPVPVTVTTVDPVPTGVLVDDNDEMVGAGLSTSRLAALDDPLLTDPFSTTTDIVAPLTNCVAGTVTVSWVALT